MHKPGPEAVRIGSNYGRLLSTFLLGLLLVRLLLHFGNDAYALIALLGAGTGLATMLQEVVRASLIPELGAAYHSNDPTRFRSTYNAALLLSLGAGIATLAAFAVLILFLPQLKISETLLTAAMCFVLFKAVQMLFVISLAPTFNMYVVSERMVSYNFWIVTERLADVGSVLLVLLFFTGADVSNAVIAYGALSASLAVIVLVMSCAVIAAQDSRLRPHLRCITTSAIKSLFRSVGWNSLVVLSFNLYTRLDMFIMNALFGLFGNLVFGIASQLTSYVRILAMGLVTGIDAVSARLTSATDADQIRQLMRQSTRLQGVIVFPAACGLFLFAQPILEFWVGGRLENPDQAIPPMVTLVRILTIGIAARSVSEGWMRILAGAGNVRSYAPAVLLGAIANPVLIGILFFLLPQSIRFTAPAWAFAVLVSIVHLGVLPAIVASQCGTSYREIIQPLVRPFLATAACVLIILPVLAITTWDLSTFLILLVVFSGLYAAVSIAFLVNGDQRRRMANALLSFFSRSTTTT